VKKPPRKTTGANPDETSIVADELVLLPCESLTTALKVAPLSA
jgi:hypothetical protein